MRLLREYYTTSEAARQLGVSVRTVQLWVESGVLEATKTPGGHRRIDRNAVERMVALPAQPHDEISGKLSALIVEDDHSQAKLLGKLIEMKCPQLTVRFARNGFEGLIEMARNPPRVLITDLIMPHMDGFAMLNNIQSDPTLKKVDTLVITAMEEKEIQHRGGLPSHIRRLFRKPVNLAALEQELNQLVAQHTPQGSVSAVV